MMVKGRLKDCLIILTPGIGEASENFKYVYNNGKKLLKTIIMKIARFREINEKLRVYIFYGGNLEAYLKEIKDTPNPENTIEAILIEIYNYFFDEETSYSISGETNKKFVLASEIKEYDRVIICGHLHLSFDRIKKIYNERMSKLSQETSKYKVLKKLENMINGNGSIILTSYTIKGEGIKTASDDLIKKLESSQKDSDTEEIYLDLFDRLWNIKKNKLLFPVIEDLKMHSFFCLHDKEHFKNKKTEIKNLIETMEKDISSRESFKDSLKEEIDLLPLEKFKKGPPKNEDEFKAIKKLLYDIVDAIIDYEKSQG